MNHVDADDELGVVSWVQYAAISALIMGCRETGLMYRKASRSVSLEEHRALLLSLSRRRSSFVDDLSLFTVGRHGPPWVGSTGGAVRRALRWLATVQGTHDGDAFRDCANEESRTLRLYARALRREWPVEMRAILAEQAREMEKNYDEMRRLRGLH